MFYEIDNSLLKQEDIDAHVHWFRDSKKERDMFVWKDVDENIIRVQLCYDDVVVEWDKSSGIRTGNLHSSSRLSKSASRTYAYHNRPDERLLKYVKHLFRHVQSTDEKLPSFLRKVFNVK